MFGTPGWSEMMIVGVIALLLFGKRLPEVARSFGKGMREFKQGLAGFQDELHSPGPPSRRESRPASRPEPEDDDRGEFTAPKFQPPTEPVETQHSA